MLIHHVVSVEGALILHRTTPRCEGGGGGGGAGGGRAGLAGAVIRGRHSRKGCPQRSRLGDFDFLAFSEHHRAAGINALVGVVCVRVGVDCVVCAPNAHPSVRPRGCPTARARR